MPIPAGDDGAVHGDAEWDGDDRFRHLDIGLMIRRWSPGEWVIELAPCFGACGRIRASPARIVVAYDGKGWDAVLWQIPFR